MAIKSTIGCSISRTVVVFPFITVRLGVFVSEGSPPENITTPSRGSLQDSNKTNLKHSFNWNIQDKTHNPRADFHSTFKIGETGSCLPSGVCFEWGKTRDTGRCGWRSDQVVKEPSTCEHMNCLPSENQQLERSGASQENRTSAAFFAKSQTTIEPIS